jgi:CRISPR-associated protein Csy3
MTTTTSPKITVPKVLSHSRALSPGHVVMFSTSSEGSEVSPIIVREEPLRGLNASAKSVSDKKETEAVLQVVESAELAPNHDTLVLRGKITATKALLAPHACNEPSYTDAHEKIIQSAAEQGLIKELANRYALNILSGQWGWRNALESSSVKVTVKWNVGGVTQSVSAMDLLPSATDTFNLELPEYVAYVDAIETLGTAIAESILRKKGYSTIFSVEAHLHMGIAARVYPSQEWASETMKKESLVRWPGGKGVTRVLAKLGGKQAIINDRKSGNAMRVVDTWYAEGKEGAPIAVEPYGANSHHSTAHRSSKGSIFEIIGKLCDKQPLSREETLFYVASCIRGGVYSGA